MVILRNKEEWRVYPEELARRSKDNIKAVRSGLKELEGAGYIKTYKKSIGRGMGMQYFRFCADRKISNKAFEQLKNDLEKDLQVPKM